MCRLGGGRRREAEDGLARGVEPVLEAAERGERFVVVEQLGGACDRLQAGERLREPVQSSPTWVA